VTVTPDLLDKIATDLYLSPDFSDLHIEQAMHEHSVPQLLTALGSAKHVLELGYGNGILTEFLLSMGIQPEIVEGSPLLCGQIQERHGNSVICHEALFAEFSPPRPYEAVFALYILEHVDCPRTFLQQAAEWVTPGGLFFAAVPNRNSLHRRLAIHMGIQEKLQDLSSRDHAVGHQRVYDLPTLRSDLTAAGLTPVQEMGFFLKPLPNSMMLDYPPALIAALNKVGEGLPPELMANIAIMARRDTTPTTTVPTTVPTVPNGAGDHATVPRRKPATATTTTLSEQSVSIKPSQSSSEPSAHATASHSPCSFEDFRRMACDRSLDENEKIDDPLHTREGKEEAIFADILTKALADCPPGGRIVEIGPGCGRLPQLLLQHCVAAKQQLTLVDSAEMLALLPSPQGIRKVAGCFPQGKAALSHQIGQVDLVLAYSLAHYIVAHADIWAFCDAALSLLAPGGRLLIGDIPSLSKRERFLASAAGAAFHRAHYGDRPLPRRLQQNPAKDETKPDGIDDSLVFALLQRGHAVGIDAYLLPQPPHLPMANRRVDLLFCRP